MRTATSVAALLALALSALMSIAGSCAIEPDASREDRQQMLRELVTNVLVPSYAELARTSAALEANTRAFAAMPTPDGLIAMRATYREARAAYERCEAFAFGPLEDIAITGGAIHTWPADTMKLDALLAGSTAVDLRTVQTLPANQRGLPALEHMLFDRARGDDAFLALFVAPAEGARRAELTASIAAELAQKTAAVLAAWNGGYAHDVAEAGVASPTFPAQNQAVDKIVTGLVSLCELMVMKKLAKPLGMDTGGAVQPALEEAPRSGASLDDLRENLRGIEAVFTGRLADRGGKGLADAVRATRPDAATRFEQTLRAAFDAQARITLPFADALVSQRAEVDAFYQAVRQIKLGVQTELASALGASIGFGYSDTD